MTEIRKDLQSDEVEDAAVRRSRLLRIGLINKDQGILAAVKADYILEYGSPFGEKVFERLVDNWIEEINKADIIRGNPELKGMI